MNIHTQTPLQEYPLFSIAEIRAFEQALFLQHNSYKVMENAGHSVVDAIMNDFPQLRENQTNQISQTNQTIHIVLGSGNNAGDGLVVAGVLKQKGCNVVAYQTTNQIFIGDAQKAFEFALANNVSIIPFQPFVCGKSDIIIDALFGIGLSRAVEGIAQNAIQHINTCRRKNPQVTVYAIDVPSGLFADTGTVIKHCGVDNYGMDNCVIADVTITFIADKIGLHTGDGKYYAGKVLVAPLGAEEYIQNYPATVFRYSYQHNDNKRLVSNQHKGDFGHSLVIGGGKNLFGAAALSAISTLKVGVGKVSLLTHHDYHNQYHIKETPLYEVMRCVHLPTVEDLDIFSTVILGPGLGRDDWGKEYFDRVMQRLSQYQLHKHKPQQQCKNKKLPVLIDADGLWHLANADINNTDSNTMPVIAVITPHEAEAARLLHTDIDTLCADKISAVKELAQRYRCIAVLKGAGTLISDGKTVWINTTGNVNLATAGSGDVLAGIIGGYLSQINLQADKKPDNKLLINSVLYSVYKHGLAADSYAHNHHDKSLRATEIWDYL